MYKLIRHIDMLVFGSSPSFSKNLDMMALSIINTVVFRVE